MTRRIFQVIVVGLFVAVNTALYAQAEPDHLKVIIGMGQLGTANTLIADAEGYFAAQNIEIEYVPVSTSVDPEAMALLVSGQVDVLQTAWTAGLFNAMTRGAEVKVVAAPTYNDPEACSYGAFVVTSGRSENFDAESLRGASVVMASSASEYYFDTWLHNYGMSLDDVVLESIPTAARPEALANGTIELAALVEPFLSRGISELGFEVVVSYSDVAPESSVSVLTFGPNMLNREDDLPVRYITAYLQGARQFNEGPTERNLEILSPALEMDVDVLTSMCWIPFREDGLLNTDTALDFMNWLHERGLLDETLEVDQFYDPSYVEQAYERLIAMAAPEATATMAE